MNEQKPYLSIHKCCTYSDLSETPFNIALLYLSTIQIKKKKNIPANNTKVHNKYINALVGNMSILI